MFMKFSVIAIWIWLINTSAGLAMTLEEYHTIYPFPQMDRAQCDQTDIAYWQAEATKLISTEHLEKKSHSDQNLLLEKNIQINALITLAYARIASVGNRREIYPIWLFAGANASHIVGESLKLNFKYVNRLPLEAHERVDFLAAQAFKSPLLGKQVANGNQGVYLDIFWKYLSADICGSRTTVRLLDSLGEKGRREANSWKRVINQKTVPIEVSSLVLALEYVDYEQGLLQKIMYDSASSQISNKLKLFNKFAILKLEMPDSPSFMSFDEFTKSKHHLRSNLANFKSRVSWMKYLLTGITPYAEDIYNLDAGAEFFRDLQELNLEILEIK